MEIYNTENKFQEQIANTNYVSVGSGDRDNSLR